MVFGDVVVGYLRGMSKGSSMDKDAAARIQSKAAREPDTDSARDGFDRRAQSAADRNESDRTEPPKANS